MTVHIYLQHNLYLIYKSELDATQTSYKKYMKFTNSKLLEWLKPAKISNYVWYKESTAGLY